MIIHVHTCPEWIYITFGVILARALPLGVNFIQNDGGDILDTMKQLRNCAMLVLSPGNNHKNWKIVKQFIDSVSPSGEAKCNQVPHLRYLIGHGFNKTVHKIKQLSDLMSEHYPDVRLEEACENDAAVLFATSGSTGASKIAVHTHASMLVGRRMKDRFVYESKYVFFNNDPFHWIGSFPFHLFYGQKRVTTTRLSLDEHQKVMDMLKVIHKERCNVMLAWALTLHTMLNEKVSVQA